jgi:hypothetical protein
LPKSRKTVTSSGERGLRNGLRLRETGKTFVAYHDLLSDWKKVVNRIDREQHINWPYPSAAFNLEIDNFLGKNGGTIRLYVRIQCSAVHLLRAELGEIDPISRIFSRGPAKPAACSRESPENPLLTRHSCSIRSRRLSGARLERLEQAPKTGANAMARWPASLELARRAYTMSRRSQPAAFIAARWIERS